MKWQSCLILLNFASGLLWGEIPPTYPELYNKNSAMQTSLAEDVILNDVKWSGNEKVLDVGCGDGKLTYSIAKQLPRGSIIAIDSSAIMIDHAKKKYPAENITYFTANATSIDQIQQKFDLITMFSSFHWFDLPSDVLKKAASKLKNGGKIIILSYPSESQDWLYYKEAFLSKDKWAPAFEKKMFDSFFSASMFDREAKKLGLLVRKNSTSDRFQVYSSLTEFKESIKGWLIWFAPSLPLSEYEEYTEMVIEKGQKQFSYDNQGHIRVPYKSIVVILEKHGSKNN